MAERVCPWWLGYLLASALRRLLHHPDKIVAPYLRPGMMVLEPGPGMGFFTLPMARAVGPSGRIVAVDVQPKMINGLRRRAQKGGLLDRIDARLASADSMGIGDLAGKVDFTLAFAVVHEMPSSAPFFVEAAAASRPGARMLLAEPSGHVPPEKFEEELRDADKAGLLVVERPAITRCTSALLEKR